MSRKVLITEKVSQECVDALRSRGYEVDVKLKLSPEELKAAIAPYDALIVRSATKVTEDLLDSAPNLKIIGRAGVHVDNIDINAATKRDIIVCNSPTSNIISATEYTFGLMLAAVRNIAQANKFVHEGRWQRHRFMGTELFGKTLGIFGLGRVGSAVAERARAFGMNVIAHDPYCTQERADKVDVQLFKNVDDIIERADIITVHLPKTPDTIGMFGAKEFAKMKKGVILINAACGGIYDVEALADFVAAGKIGAAAIDVFDDEPCYESPLHSFDNVLLTPHISAVTNESLIRAGNDIAEYIWAGLEGSIVPTAIMPSALPAEVIDELRPYATACRLAGRIIKNVVGGVPKSLSLTCEGQIKDADPAPLVAGLIDGVVSYKSQAETSADDAIARANRHGIEVYTSSRSTAEEYSSAVQIKADNASLAFTLYGLDNSPRIVSFMGYKIDIAPAKHSVVFEYVDGPGRIGTIGTILGDSGINITTMQIGTKEEEKCALVYINVERALDSDTIDKLNDAIDFRNMWTIDL